ncbi:MAG: OsmC family protein [Desulfovibrio sp.]|jgi:uncharacterized OsmC-like protein|nr:OsmC family protein [Desulfovibrio sp.]
MAATSTVRYLGGLRTECAHLRSGAVIRTDAPVDNHGKGEAFSPTDLFATSLAACAMTIMGIYGEGHDIDVTGMTAEVQKTMSQEPPRRVASIDVTVTMPDREYSDRARRSLEQAALTCPVHKSLHPDIKQNIILKWAK